MTAVRPPRPLSLACAALVLPLCGCGVGGAEFHPGTAAQVGDDVVTVAHVDEVAADYCAAVEDQIQGGTKVPMRYLRSGVAGQLAMRAAVEQLADEYGVTPGTQYRSQLSQIKGQASSLDDDIADSYVEVESVQPYVADVLTSVGGIRLEEESEPSIEARQQAGLEALDEWAQQEDVSFAPRYGLEFRDGQPVRVDEEISYPLSDTAKAGLAEEPDAEYAAALPDVQTCG